MTRSVSRAVPLSEQAADILRDQILSGRFRPGERLNEVSLATELGVSRSPLREGLRKLADEGLVELSPNRGAFVASFTQDSMRELMDFRQALDVMAARLTARRFEEVDFGELEAAIVAASAAHRSPGVVPSPPWESDFHILVLKSCDNSRIHDRGVEVHTQLHLARFRSGATAQRADAAREEHEAILAHIRKGDEEGASRSMFEHLDRAREHMVDMLHRDATLDSDAG